jgi:hypothetical protein
VKKIVTALALATGILFADGLAVAEAQIILPGSGVIVGAPPPPGLRRHRHWRRDGCYTERRRVRVMTEYGPRLRWRRVRVCY